MSKTYKVIFIISDNSCKQGWRRRTATFRDTEKESAKNMATHFISSIVESTLENDGTYFVHLTVDIDRGRVKSSGEQ
jgi:hypothetical protein